MPPADQLEGLAVSRTLVAWGYAADRDLLAAGAIHDVGKSLAPPSSLYRTLMTLLGALTPWLVPALARRFSTIRLLDQHAGTGASMAAEAGVASEVVRLIAEHHVTTAEPRLVALQMADALH